MQEDHAGQDGDQCADGREGGRCRCSQNLDPVIVAGEGDDRGTDPQIKHRIEERAVREG